MTNAFPRAMNGDGYGLNTGSRCAHDTDSTAPHAIGKTETTAVNNRRTAVGSHNQQALFARHLLELHFIGQRNIIAIQKNMPTEREGLARNIRGVATRDGNENPARLWRQLDGGFEAFGAVLLVGDLSPLL